MLPIWQNANAHVHDSTQLTIALAAELGNQTVLQQMLDMITKRDLVNQMGPDGGLHFEVFDNGGSAMQ